MGNLYKKVLLGSILFVALISGVCSFILSSVQQNRFISRAKDMTYVKWTPPETIPVWNSDKKFDKGMVYEGIPYTCSINQMRSAKEFLQKLNSSNSLALTENSWTGPNYGNDCSGFVSAVWDIPRCTTHDIEKYTKRINFNDLRPGDALLTDEHIMLFSNWNDVKHTKLTVYEQTPPKARIQIYLTSYLKSKGYQAIRLRY